MYLVPLAVQYRTDPPAAQSGWRRSGASRLTYERGLIGSTSSTQIPDFERFSIFPRAKWASPEVPVHLNFTIAPDGTRSCRRVSHRFITFPVMFVPPV